MNILFVCTGNTCRSSMAEGIFKFLLKENNIENIEVSSAGISAFDGESANEKAINTLNKKSIDIKDHKARSLTKEIVERSDLILTMTNNHKQVIISTLPSYENKVYTLKEYAHMVNDEDFNLINMDISDPFGLNHIVYEQCAEEIEENLKRIIKNLGIARK